MNFWAKYDLNDLVLKIVYKSESSDDNINNNIEIVVNYITFCKKIFTNVLQYLSFILWLAIILFLQCTN